MGTAQRAVVTAGSGNRRQAGFAKEQVHTLDGAHHARCVVSVHKARWEEKQAYSNIFA